MTVRLFDKDTSILLGATLMHWGVPFRAAVRRPLTEAQQAKVDEASDKLVGLRETCQRLQAPDAQKVDLSDEEISLLIAVVEDCLNECGDDATELRLQLKTGERDEVETLLERLRQSLGSRCVKLV
jgi:hypothetical protein